MESFWSDLKHAARLLARNPSFTVIVILALALGIGANTAVFSVLNAVLLKPLPYPNASEVVSIYMRFTGIGLPDDLDLTSPPEFMDVRRMASSFADVSAYTNASYNIRAGDLPERAPGAMVSANFFRLLGVDAHLGRPFTDEEERPGSEQVIVLGHGLWQSRFGSDERIVGRVISVSGKPHTVIGVAPPEFGFPNDAQLWTPLAITDAQLSPDFRGNHGLFLLARMKDGVTLESMRADMERVTRMIEEGAPEYPYEKFNFAVLAFPLIEDLVGDLRPALLMLMGAVGFVLLIACANVANLLLVRASVREREIGIRAALGAGRSRVLRQLLTESLLLSAIGAAAGLLFARAALAAIASAASDVFPRIAEAELDAPTLLFTTAVAVTTGLIFGIAPALQVSQASTHDSLKEGGRSGTAGSGRHRLRKLLVVSEVALSLALLAGAGLLIKSFIRLQNVDPGFNAEGVLTARIALPQARYSEPDRIRSFFRDLQQRIEAIPGVESVGAISALPLSGTGSSGTSTPDSPAAAEAEAHPEADMRSVTPGYFEAIGIELVRGRYFEERDNETAAPVAIIDETMARTYWPNADPIGQRIKRGGATSPQPWMTIVGVVRHVRYQSLERPSRVQLYAPAAQTPGLSMALAIRTTLDPEALALAVQRETMALDPEQPVFEIRPMTDLMASAVMRRQIVMTLLAFFAGIALVLAGLGIYGIVSYWVSQRSREIGIRMALGAGSWDVLRMVASQSLTMVVAGVLVGAAAAGVLTRVMETLLFDVSATDVPIFVLVSASLLATGVIATVVPARRATAVDPVHTLKQE